LGENSLFEEYLFPFRFWEQDLYETATDWWQESAAMLGESDQLALVPANHFLGVSSLLGKVGPPQPTQTAVFRSCTELLSLHSLVL
jgi:hypothetical protein